MQLKNRLRRYTNLASLIHMLVERKITLLSPSTWDDRNDAYFLSQYKERKPCASVLALCFTMSSERYQHWRLFADGMDGVCIEFKKDTLLSCFTDIERIRAKQVDYGLIAKKEATPPAVRDLPFLKRYAFKDEEEFRIIYEHPTDIIDFLDLEFDTSSIARIILSPWIPEVLSNSVKFAIHQINGAENLTITRTSLVDNESWKSAADRAVDF